MKKNLTLAVMILLIFSIPPAFAGETWKLTSLDWQPYSGANMATQGNSIQKLRELLKKEGIELLVEFYPWKRAQKKAGQPDYVGYFPAWPEEVGEGFFASPAIDWSTIDVMKQSKSQITFKDIDELFKNYRVGYVKTYVYPEPIDKAIKKYPQNAKDMQDETSLLKILAKGRCDVGLTDANVMMYIAGKEGISGIETVGESLMKKELVISFRKGADNQKRLEILKKLLK